jgi:hypothetical protein
MSILQYFLKSAVGLISWVGYWSTSILVSTFLIGWCCHFVALSYLLLDFFFLKLNVYDVTTYCRDSNPPQTGCMGARRNKV